MGNEWETWRWISLVDSRGRERERESNGSSSSIVKLVSLELLYFYDTLRPLKNYYTTLLLFSNNQLFRDICALRYFGDSSTFFLSLLLFSLLRAKVHTRWMRNENRDRRFLWLFASFNALIIASPPLLLSASIDVYIHTRTSSVRPICGRLLQAYVSSCGVVTVFLILLFQFSFAIRIYIYIHIFVHLHIERDICSISASSIPLPSPRDPPLASLSSTSVYFLPSIRFDNSDGRDLGF